MALYQGVNILASLLTIPITSHYLGAELFGLWMITIGLVGFLVFADLGIGVGFRNELIVCYVNNDREEPGVWVANALLVMLFMMCILILASTFVLPLLPFDGWLKIKTTSAQKWLLPTLQCLGISFAVTLPLMLLEYIATAYQKGYYTYICLLFGRLLGFSCVILAVYLKLSLPWLVAAFIGLPYTTYFVAFIVLWGRTSWLRPAWNKLSLKRIRKLSHVGFGMLAIRVSHALAAQGPALLTASLIGLAEAGVVSVAQKILSVSTIVTQPFVVSLNGALGEAYHRKEKKWIVHILRKITLIPLLIASSICAFILAIGGNTITTFLGRAELSVPRSFLFVFSLLSIVVLVRMVLSPFLTVIGHIHLQAIYRLIFVGAAYYMCYFLSISTASQIALNFIFFGELTVVVAMYFEIKNALKSL